MLVYVLFNVLLSYYTLFIWFYLWYWRYYMVMRSTNKVDIVPPYVVECVSASAQLDSPTEDEPHIEMCPHTVTQLTCAPKLLQCH